jgi:hypothetical protein
MEEQITTIKNSVLATAVPELVKTDKNTLTRYRIVEEKIDLGDLIIEKRGIEERLAKNMDDKTLLAWARANYPEFDASDLQARLDEINKLLEIK